MAKQLKVIIADDFMLSLSSLTRLSSPNLSDGESGRSDGNAPGPEVEEDRISGIQIMKQIRLLFEQQQDTVFHRICHCSIYLIVEFICFRRKDLDTLK